MQNKYDVIVIGGGPAGMAAALAASKQGAKVLILERDYRLGGILNQCIHNGFGLHYFKTELTGPEYAYRFRSEVEKDRNVEVVLEAMVLSVTPDKKVTAICPSRGLFTAEGGAVVLAMGCRERTAGAIQMPGSRPAGIYTAGMAQRIMNIEGYKVGKKVVILGSGDIGLIMARRMTYEGAKVLKVLELMPYSSGLKRNIVQCLSDYDIPLEFNRTVTRVIGKTRLEGLYYAPVENGKPNLEKEQFIECDTLLLSVGLIPENDLVQDMGIDFDRITSGAVVDEHRQTSVEGIFACGNVLHVHDLVDNVSMEAEIAGESAAKYALGNLQKTAYVKVGTENGVRYALPQKIGTGEGKVKIYFRVGAVYKNVRLNVRCGDKIIYTRKCQILAPGEMGSVEIDKKDVTGDVTVGLEA